MSEPLLGPAPVSNYPPPEPLEDRDGDDQDPNDVELPQIDLRTVVIAFLSVVPEPTDEQLHAFAELLGIPYQTFENEVFTMFSDAVEDPELDTDEDVEDVVTDDMDMFLVSFFTYNHSPSEEQIHHLAGLLGITPEELEERVYRMLQGLEFEDQVEDEEDVHEEHVENPGQPTTPYLPLALRRIPNQF